MYARGLWCLLILSAFGSATAQNIDSSGLLKVADVDSLYIVKFARPNIIRGFYGTQGTAVQYGSVHKGNPDLNTAMYSNVNDFVGFGLTYKILDADVSFSLPATRLVQQDLQNLSQFRLGLGFTSRNYIVRAFYTDSRGVIAADQEGKFQSTPDIHQYRAGAQFTWIFNSSKYSYRAFMFQDERQLRSAGSFLLRLEPFYRGLGVGSKLVPASLDNVSTYGDMVGLEYLKAPGLLVMPGYGGTIIMADGRFFVSPMVLAGGGVAFNFYKGRAGEFAYTSWELSGSAVLNAGYNGKRLFFNTSFHYDVNYAPVKPAYFLTSNVRMSITLGYRFSNLEKFIPTELF
jgi:GNAT superfamily N-acetyltransferase